MQTAHRILAITVFLIIGATLVARADNVDLKDLLDGKHVPLSLQLKDLDGSWRRVRVSPSDAGATFGMYQQLLTGAAGGVFYTKGESVLIAGETYVIAYQQPSKLVDTMSIFRGGTPAELPPVTPETRLTLTLIQLRTAGSLTDIRPFNMEEAIADQTSVHRVITGENDKFLNDLSANNLKQFGLGLAMSASDHNGKLPDLSDPQGTKKALTQYISNDKVFLHPKTGQPYRLNPSLSGKEYPGSNAVSIVVVYEPVQAADGTRAVLYCDGHVARVTEANWQELKKISNIPTPPQR